MKKTILITKYRKAFRRYSQTDFNYGSMDCCLFVARVLHDVTGRDYSAGFTYSSKTQAYRIIKAHGGLSHFLDSILGESGDYSDGDPVLCEDELNGEFLGIYINNRVISKSKIGLMETPKENIVRGWSIA